MYILLCIIRLSPGDFKLPEDRDHMLHSSVFFVVPGMSYPHQMSNITTG